MITDAVRAWRGLYHKTFYDRNKSCIAIIKCLCYCQSLFTGFYKHNNFLCYRINYGCNTFYDTGPKSWVPFSVTLQDPATQMLVLDVTVNYFKLSFVMLVLFRFKRRKLFFLEKKLKKKSKMVFIFEKLSNKLDFFL
jgi:hypothetical protein